ncbi:hypothetical protein LTR10_014612 [Elasticomyces elasticus]|uniref:Acyltransferase 3 domain-containing protein n=1 Tax=Exophiala sideris TaxID=1016849 RepID=A0ABR0JSS4_9EURO|nr:hypothetical protein LTR10_014612 [Elasticomyces elasticus]KAK5040589.1 hypothetical protein LTS07_001089 [Exophiala sideris]KAK5042986.1 hypothetical protein LTR13_000756 [Exophiala sideris]KAK5068967.1 hypothetical protein LTR69_001090 [Exophiala sideris]KAK5186564.1 hypothetical protein LTR44_001621 [Eurotiomycetes sp. CCFEE 6388]
MANDSKRLIEEPRMTTEKHDIFVGEESAPFYTSVPLLRHVHGKVLLKVLSLARPTHAYKLSKRLGYCFVPQLLRSHIWGESAVQLKNHPTSYLSGLRGLAAVKVFTFHFLNTFSDAGFVAWGEDEQHKYFLELPIIRYLFASATAHIFFGVAGYMTTLRFFQICGAGTDQVAQAKVLRFTAGSLFRRALRLYLPTSIITLITIHYIYFGLYEHNRAYLNQHDKYFPGPGREILSAQFPTYSEQMLNWSQEMIKLTNLFQLGVEPTLDPHLWSILAEMQGSLLLFLILVATATCRRHVRWIAMWLMTIVLILWGHDEAWVYTSGGIVALIDLYLTETEQNSKVTLTPVGGIEEKPNSSWPARVSAIPPWLKRFLRLVLFLVTFYLLSYPISGYGFYGWDGHAPGYVWLNKYIPQSVHKKERFWQNIATALLLLLIVRSDQSTSVWRRLLNSKLLQYLGKISFAMYLLHGPFLHFIGYMIPHYIWWSLGVESEYLTDLPWSIVIVVGWAANLLLLMGAADVWTREVEGRCVKFVKKLEEHAFATTM